MILSVEHGSFGYRRDCPVLRDVSFSLEQGNILAVLGPNGAGKTTLLRCLTGMLPWDGGRSALDGTDIRRIPRRTLWRNIAYAPQAKTPSAYTVSEMVLLGRNSRLNVFSAPGKEDLRAVDAVLEELSILHLADKKCTELSGGEFQMVLIARALAAEPAFLILDEPESNLDFKNQLTVLNTISGLAQRGISCIFNTHYPAHALQRAGYSLLLDPGGSYRFGPTASVITEENIRASFGVNAVISQIETDTGTLQNITAVNPGSVASGTEPPDGRCIATVTVLSSGNEAYAAVNRVLQSCGELVIGRMGLPYRECGLYLITVMLDGPRSTVAVLSQRLGTIPGISVKTTYASGSFPS